MFLPEESQGRGSIAAVYGVAQSWTQLKRLSSSSSSLPEICNILLSTLFAKETEKLNSLIAVVKQQSSCSIPTKKCQVCYQAQAVLLIALQANKSGYELLEQGMMTLIRPADQVNRSLVSLRTLSSWSGFRVLLYTIERGKGLSLASPMAEGVC